MTRPTRPIEGVHDPTEVLTTRYYIEQHQTTRTCRRSVNTRSTCAVVL